MLQTIIVIFDRLKPETHEFGDYDKAREFYMNHAKRSEVLAIYWLDSSYNLHRYLTI